MKLLSTVSNLMLDVVATERKLFVLKETLKLENELRSRIDFVKLHDCLEKLKLGVNKEVSFRLEANEKGLYGQFVTCLIPLEGCTIKQISWKGYDGKGQSKNHKTIIEKARKLKEKIESMTNLKVYINYYSFEKDSRNIESEFSILATFTIE